MQPLVSVIIPLFNASHYIKRCVNSVLAQDYKNIEIIIVDDGSNDDSLSIASSLESDSITVVSQINQGACVARNHGVKKSAGKYVKLLDADDELLPGIISKQVILSESLPENTIVYGDYYLCDEINNRLHYVNTFVSKSEQTAKLIFKDILTSTPLHRRWMLDKIGGFDERFKNGQEWNLHIRLSSEGYFFHHIKEPIYKYYVFESENRISSKSKLDSKKNNYLIKKISMTEERLGSAASGDIDAAFSFLYWRAGRFLYKEGLSVESSLFIEMAKSKSKNYKRYWPSIYSVFFTTFGFNFTERLIDISTKGNKMKKIFS